MSDLSSSTPHTRSATSLTKLCGLASGVAALVYTCVILPAEFGIDPTGFGQFSGLIALSQPGTADAETAPEDPGSRANTGSYSRHEIQLSLPAGKDIEYKFQLGQGDKFAYQWSSGEHVVHVDFHGEPAGDTTGYFESYSLGEVTGLEGTLTAPFDGSHGWYWRNDSDRAITINLQVQGRFEVLGIR
ncbi:hypothetical protein [Marinobacterium lutimaris]|uniref:Transmembrane anchor protein n=1 Tax=Marinobacterium lutimaris TaxID=568106 RepID=A0A1H6D7E9_9GAMM|nr:hypothetical protein [Marinobacterium lutimaris]SEG81201.1 hypothetical protein SAMN05444390_105150 [Marinobacterium lutimaris]